MQTHNQFSKKKQNAIDSVRFMSGFFSKFSGKTKITRKDASNILNLICESTGMPIQKLIDCLSENWSQNYEEMFLVEQYNRNHGCEIPQKLQFNWNKENNNENGN